MTSTYAPLPDAAPDVPRGAMLAKHADKLAVLVLEVKDFGAVGDGVTDDLTAFNNAIKALGDAGGTIRVRDGVYRLSGPLHLNKPVLLTGQAVQRYGTMTCVLKFDAGVDGVVIDVAGANSKLENLTVQAAGKTTEAYGIRLLQVATISACYVSGWKTNGIIIDTRIPGTNCNCFTITETAIDACGGDGVRITGSDSNAGCLFKVSSRVNGGWGFQDTSLTGSTYVQCHTEANTLGGYRVANSGPGGMLVNCYAEGDQPAPQVLFPAVIFGGTWGTRNATGPNVQADRADINVGLTIGANAGAIVDVPTLWFGNQSADLPITASTLLPYISENTVCSATPMLTGMKQWQVFTYINNTIYTLELQDESVLPGSGLRLKTPRVVLRTRESIRFLAVSETSAWELSRSLDLIPANSVATPGDVAQATRVGRAAFAAGASSIVITNPLVRADSLVFALMQSADATLSSILRVVPANGSFTIVGNAAATATPTVMWWLG